MLLLCQLELGRLTLAQLTQHVRATEAARLRQVARVPDGRVRLLGGLQLDRRRRDARDDALALLPLHVAQPPSASVPRTALLAVQAALSS